MGAVFGTVISDTLARTGSDTCATAGVDSKVDGNVSVEARVGIAVGPRRLVVESADAEQLRTISTTASTMT